MSRKLLELETSNLVCKFSLKEGVGGPGHVTPTIFGSTVGYSSDSLASCLLMVNSKRGCVPFAKYFHVSRLIGNRHFAHCILIADPLAEEHPAVST